jgi:hypothetical protein
VKFCFLLGKTAAETVTVLKEAFKDDAMGKAQVYEWFNHFKRGEMSVEDNHIPATLPPARLTKMFVRQAVLADPCQTIDELSEIAGVSWSLCQCI